MKKEKKIIHMTLMAKWFDMILNSQKTDEYREVKSYWTKRLTKVFNNPEDYMIRFSNGYSPDSRKMDCDITAINIGYGEVEWGALPNDPVYIISIANPTPINF